MYLCVVLVLCVSVCACVLLVLLSYIIVYYLKGMYERVYVFGLYCIIVLYYYYITVLHYVGRLERIWICVIQIPFWLILIKRNMVVICAGEPYRAKMLIHWKLNQHENSTVIIALRCPWKLQVTACTCVVHTSLFRHTLSHTPSKNHELLPLICVWTKHNFLTRSIFFTLPWCPLL